MTGKVNLIEFNQVKLRRVIKLNLHVEEAFNAAPSIVGTAAPRPHITVGIDCGAMNVSRDGVRERANLRIRRWQRRQ